MGDARDTDWQTRFERADRQVFDQIRQRQEAAASLAVVEAILVERCQQATDDNADLRSALLELRIVRAHLDPRLAIAQLPNDDRHAAIPQPGSNVCVCGLLVRDGTAHSEGGQDG